MKIAVISDIHGNLEALKTTLQDIKNRNIDKIICLGDIIEKGHHPEECVKLIRDNCEIVIQGNCDTDFNPDVYTVSKHHIPVELMKKRAIRNLELLSDESRKYLMNLQYSYEFYMSGSLIRMFHAHPVKNTNIVLNEDDAESKYKMFEPSENTISQEVADIVIYGHLHLPFMNKFYNKTLINVGSVGNAFDPVRDDKKDSNSLETTASYYLIMDGEYGNTEYGGNLSFEFVRVQYDFEKELEDLDKNLEPKDYEKEIREGVYRNMRKILERKVGK